MASSEAVIGIDIGGTKMLAGLFGSGDELLHSTYVPVAELPFEALLERIETTVREFADGQDVPVVAIGCGIPATVDQRNGSAVAAANLPIANAPFRDELSSRLGVPVFIDNDANAAALAEHRRGAGRGTQHMICLTMGTGLGGGIIINGQLLRGSTGAAGEVGHMSIDMHGPGCSSLNCPNVGCLEGSCSGSALARSLGEFVRANPESALASAVASGEPVRGETVHSHAAQGDADAISLLEQMGVALGVGMANFVNIFNPEAIVIGGGLIAAQEWIVPIAERTIRERAMPPGNTQVRIEVAAFGAEAGMVGAGLLAREGYSAYVGEYGSAGTARVTPANGRR